MDKGGRRPRDGVVGPRGQERDDVVTGDGLQGGDRLGRWRGRGPDRLHAVRRDRARPRVLRKHQGLDLAPQLVLVCLAPDTAHLGQGVTLDHTLYPAATSLVAWPCLRWRA